MDLPRDARSVAEIPHDFKPVDLGPRSELIRKIQSVVPSADFTDPSWGQIETSDFSVEVSLGEEEPINSIMLHIRGGGDVVGLVAELLAALELRAVDAQNGEFFEPAAARESFAAWRAFRDRVVQGPSGSWVNLRRE